MEELMMDVENLSRTSPWEVEIRPEGNEKLIESIKEARNFVEMLKNKLRGGGQGELNEVRNYINKNPNDQMVRYLKLQLEQSNREKIFLQTELEILRRGEKEDLGPKVRDILESEMKRRKTNENLNLSSKSFF